MDRPMSPSSAATFTDLTLWSAVSPDNRAYYDSAPTRPYIICFTINPVDQVPIWIASIAAWFNQYEIDFVYRHPSQALSIDFFERSIGTLLWNGTLPIFAPLKQFLAANGLQFSFVECGFFPQIQHVYFDRMGINVESSLAQDDLRWLPPEFSSTLQQTRERFFQDVVPYAAHHDYIFIPLQLANDSNIQLHSRFGSGMQTFIDYIETCYPNETLVFKKHPRDDADYQISSKRSFWSTACSRALIKGAKAVHGINSTVLFEAELYGAETIIEGECLLTRHAHRKNELLAAIILWQFDIVEANFSLRALAERSYLALDQYLLKYESGSSHSALSDGEVSR
jgi:hypothetical protein